MASVHTIKTKLLCVKKIVHLADIHIRLYKRHREYTDVFDTLYDLLGKRDLTETVIVVAGDIVHSKTDMSPEMVRVVSDFLTKLSSLAPTIVIPGNHDLNLSNPNRLDALSPIIENLSLDNLHYLRESGIYTFANLQFGVHSIIGPTDDWPVAADMSDKHRKIALYHAPVNHAQTDAGYNITNRITVEDFNGFDMVMLGDIHKTQILQGKSPGKPELAYAGSLIQQNHGELPIGHGYLVWDVATCAIEEFVEVPNKVGYYTLTLTDKSIPLTPDMPENVRLRMYVGDADDTFVKKTIAILRKKYNILECTINRTKSKGGTAQAALTTIDDMNDVTQQSVHIRDFIENQFPNTAPDLIDRICEINTKLNARIGDDELPRNISWKPLLLEFENLFSYGSDNKINFENMSGLYGVFSPNATGKTSAFDALCFALYDKTPRAFKGSHIMNTRKDTFSCKFDLQIENEKYTIERTGVRKKNGEVKIEVNFYKLGPDGTTTSLNGDDRRNTNAAIRSYVGTYEDFILTTMSVQNQNSLFIETGQSDRKDLLSQFIGLTVFDRLLNLATDEIKEVAGALKSFKKTDFTQRLADVQLELQSLTVEYDDAVKKSEQLKSDVDKIQRIIDETRSAITPVPTDYDDIQIYMSNRNTIKSVLLQTDQRIATVRTQSELADQAFKKCKRDLYDLGNEENLITAHTKMTEANEAMIKLRAKLQTLRAEEKHVADKIKNLQKHEYDPNCKYCMNNVFVIDAKNAENTYYTIRNAIIKVEDQIIKGVDYIETIKVDADKYDKWNELTNMSRANERTYLDTQYKLRELVTSATVNRDKIQELDTLIAAAEEFKLMAEQNKTLEDKIAADGHNKKLIEKGISELNISMMELFGKISVLQSQKESMINSIKEAEELETTYEAYETYISVIGRDGLPYKLIGAVIPTLQTEVNNILDQIVDFSVSMDVDGKNINGKIIYGDERTWPLELASGMERFISGLAIRIALMSISNLPKSNFLVIDEGFATLDSDNLHSMQVMFDIIKNQFDFVLIISHLDTMRDFVDDIIEIGRDDGFSSINV